VRLATLSIDGCSFRHRWSLGALSEGTAELIAENLHNFSLGPSHRYHRDVELLERAGIDPDWTEGARALAEVMEDALVGRYDGPDPDRPTRQGGESAAAHSEPHGAGELGRHQRACAASQRLARGRDAVAGPRVASSATCTDEPSRSRLEVWIVRPPGALRARIAGRWPARTRRGGDERTEAQRLADIGWIEWGGELIWAAGSRRAAPPTACARLSSIQRTSRRWA